MAGRLLMLPTLILRLEHALVPGRDDTLVSAVAEIMTRPCFAPLKRVAFETLNGRRMRYMKISGEVIQSYLSEPGCGVVNMDSGRHGELIAEACIHTGLALAPDYWVSYPAPLEPYVIVPHDPAMTTARIDAFCDLAKALHAVAGCVSTELGFRLAQRLGIGVSTHPEKILRMQPGTSMQRLRERRSYDMRKLDREIPSPEWGLFLSRSLVLQPSLPRGLHRRHPFPSSPRLPLPGNLRAGTPAPDAEAV
jgi:hypothetical protein